MGTEQITFTDAETTFQTVNNKRNPIPFLPENYLASLGFLREDEETYLPFTHNEFPSEVAATSMEIAQGVLDKTTLLVAHNMKFDLQWIHAVGLKYDGQIYCTQIAEFIIASGVYRPLDLSSCARRYGGKGKLDTVAIEYWDKGVQTDMVPWEVLKEYGIRDIREMMYVYNSQQEVVRAYF